MFIVVATKKFVAFDSRDNANGAFIAGFGALHAAEAADFHRSGQSNFVGKRQENFDGGAFLNVFGEKEVNTAGTDVAGFGAGFADGRTGGPSHGKWQPHAKALGGAAF
jgi:hypothetical protein